MTPFAAEAWPAVFGGLIPIFGLAAIAFVIYRAVGKNDGEGEEEDDGKNDGDDGET